MAHRYVKYSKEELEQVINSNTSIRGVLTDLGLRQTGGNYTHIKMLLDKFNINIEHFTGQAWNRGNISRNRKNPDEYLILYNTSLPIKTDRIKKWMFRDNVKEKKCENCGRTRWQGKEIPLELHHKDRNRWNNVLSNLMILCCNCHAQTDGYNDNRK
jgi:hypothetical protein